MRALHAGTRIRAERGAAGLSQQQLADRSGISRQAVGAIEGGLHRPGVDVALALAAALGVTVEALFTTPTEASVAVHGPPVDVGTAVVVSRVGARRVHVAVRRTAPQEWWPDADARLTTDGAELLPGAEADGFVVVGCDPALGLIAGLLPSRGPRRLVAVAGSTAVALGAVAGGRAHAALVHGPDGALPAPAPGTARLTLGRWRVGLASPSHRPARSLGTLTRGRTVVQREAGASSQGALLRALRRDGLAVPEGPVASGHLAVAGRVADGLDAGVTIEPAALHRDLSFLPLEEHAVEIHVPVAHQDHPGFHALADALRSRALTTRLELVGGYDLAGCGALTKDPR